MTLSRSLRSAGVLIIGAMSLALVLTAQTETATISGLVTDPSGAAVAKAEIVLQSIDRGNKMETTTNASGLYALSGVLPGQYSLTVRNTGFKQVDLLGIIVNVQDHIQQNFSLQVGSVSESVTVEGHGETVHAQSAAVSTVVDQQFVQNIPLNGRSVQALLTLVPGVVPTTDSRQLNVDGQRGVSNSMSIDGASANIGSALVPAAVGLYSAGSVMGVTSTGTTQSIATMDELQEFTVQTSGYGAELGRQSGAQISFATKSGTNVFHGSAYNYFRNEKMDANDWFLNRGGLIRPKLRQNDFGGTFGGPIVKDKTFFFLAAEDDPLLSPYSSTSVVPTQAYRNTASPAILPLLNLYPLPNGAIAANGMSGSFVLGSSVRSPVNAETIKLDQNISSKLALFARYHRAQSETVTPSVLSANNVLYTNTATATFGATWTVSPRIVDQFRFNFSRASSGTHYDFDSRGGTVLPDSSALFPTGYSAGNAAINMSITDPVLGSSGQVYIGQSEADVQHQYQVTDSISMVQGKHTFTIGGDWRRMAPLVNETQDTQTVQIKSAATAQVSMSGLRYGSGQFALNSLSLYGADTWRVSPRLTLNLGVRWERQPPPYATTGPQPFAAQNFDPNNLSLTTLAPAGTPPWKTRNTNFAPRLGAAYHLFDKPGFETVVRAAFGIYYDMGVGNALGFIESAPYAVSGTAVVGTYPAILSNPSILPPAVNLTPPLTSLTLFDPNLKMPYSLSWNAGVQQSLGRSQSISVTYIGSRGKDLLMDISKTYPANPLISATGVLSEETNLAASWYDALQVQFNRRFARGFQVLASYSLSNSRDLASDETTAWLPGSSIATAMNKGPSNYDVRHGFTAAATWKVPAPFANRALKAALGGWSLNPLVRAYSAKPLNPAYTYTVTGVVTYNLRPDVVPGQPVWLSGSQFPGGKELNIAAFSIPQLTNPAQLRQGTAARNSIRGFPASQADIALRRDFRVTERIGLQISGEVYNILNHPNFGNPSSLYGCAT